MRRCGVSKNPGADAVIDPRILYEEPVGCKLALEGKAFLRRQGLSGNILGPLLIDTAL